MSWREFDKAFNEDHRTFKMGCEFFHENPYTLCSRLNACYFFHCEPATQEKVMVHRDIEFFSDLTVYEAFYDARVFESLQQKCSDLGSSFFSIVSGLGMTAEETYHLDGGRRLQAQNYKAVNKELEVYFERTYSASLFRNAEIWTCVDSLRYRIPVSSASTP
jgi:hypothetical protein